MSHHVYPDTVSRDRDWRNFAVCRKHDPELWFPTGTTGPALLEIAHAKAICSRCPVIDECRDFAFETGQEAGVWAGLSEDDRRAMKRRRARDLTAEALQKPRPPRAQGAGRNYTTLRNENTQPTDDGHVLWTGGPSMSVQGGSKTFRQIAFAADRGHLPEGRVLTECDSPVCVHPRHISDEHERNVRALEQLAAAAEEAPAQAPVDEPEPEPVVPSAPPAPVVVEPSVPTGGCGTPAGARAHEADGEELCDDCWAAIANAVGRLERVSA